MELHRISSRRFFHTIGWALVASIVIIVIVAGLARAMLNIKAALTEKPDIALYLLLPEEEIGRSELLRETEIQRDYIADTKEGKKLIILKKGTEAWYVAEIEPLHDETH